ncbi:MAG: cytochrome c [Alicyclobacillus sp.]|nr:cytochrome c [Alicyclobacillus sp.]
MKLSPVGVFVVLIGAVAGILIWVVGLIALPNDSTHRRLADNPPIQSSAANQPASNSTSGTSTGGTGSGGNTASTGGTVQPPQQLVTLPQKDPSQINLIDTTMPGYQIFEQTCAACHGDKGQGGVGPAIYAIGQHWSEAQITAFVEQGRGMMPPRGGLSSDAQVQQVVQWLAKQTG